MNQSEQIINALESLSEKTLSNAEIKDMAATISQRTARGDSDSAKGIFKMMKDIRDNADKRDGDWADNLSPKEVGWMMKTMKALSGGRKR